MTFVIVNIWGRIVMLKDAIKPACKQRERGPIPAQSRPNRAAFESQDMDGFNQQRTSLLLRILFGIPYILFILPPIGYVALAVTMVGLGISINNIQTTSEQEKANALAIPMADAVPLNAFDNDDRGLMDEIHIAAQINNDYNYTLYEGTERDSTPHAMWLLFDPNADAKERQIRAAIVLPRADVDKFVDWMAKNINGIGQLGAVYHLNGEHKTSVPYDGVAQQAIRDEGLRQARGFFYLDPWMEGRKAALAPRDTDGLSFMQLSNNIAIVLMLIAAFKFLLHHRPKPSAIDMQ